jgi:cytoskeletal protein RodZ
MSTDSLKKFAEELKEARENSNLTIDQIFSKTRIDKKYLKAIEDGNFSIMPEVYIRAFIKEYSKAIKLDTPEVMDKYELAKKGLAVNSEKIEEVKAELPKAKKTKTDKDIKSKISEAVEQDSKSEIKDKPSKNNKTLYYALTGVLMFIFIFVIYKVFLTDPNTEIIAEKPFEEIIEEQTAANEVKKDLDMSEIKPKDLEEIKPSLKKNEQKNIIQDIPIQSLQEGIMTLTVLGTDKSWIRVVADDNNMEFMIDKGINKVITAKEKFYLHIGNSGGVKLLLDNKELIFSGLNGKVRKIFVTRDGIEYLRRTPNLNEEN